MTVAEAILLGTLQGLTEFLPVSSSGHLMLGSALLGMTEPNLLFDVLVHVATLVAVLVFLRSEVVAVIRGALRGGAAIARGQAVAAWRDDREARLAALVLIATVPTGLIGALAGRWLSNSTATPTAVGVVLIINGFVLLGSKWAGRGRDGGAQEGGKPWGVGTALLIGVGQGLAVLRGLSRSGTTITLGLAGGLSREEAFNYSFLLSVPAILGALVLELDPGALMAPGGAATHIAGFLAALPVGYLSLILLSAIVRRGGLHIFAPWCWALGGIALWLGSAS